MNDLRKFDFEGGEIRTVTDGGEIYFVGKDICDRLGFVNATDALNRHCRGVVKRYPLPTAGGVQELRVISEADMMRLICNSNLPEAERFERWVFEEVLPAIRRQGGYIAAAPEETPEQLYMRAMTVLKATVDRQQKQIEAQRLQLQSQAPTVEYAETVLASSSLLTVNSVAVHLGVSAKALNAFLCGEDWIYRQGAIWYPTAKIRDKGFCDYETVTYVNRAGEQCTRAHLKWTEQGRRAVIDLWQRKHGEAAK